MITIENFEVIGWEHAIRGMRNPKNSWAKSDSEPGCEIVTGSHEYCRECDNAILIHGNRVCGNGNIPGYVLGLNDYELVEKLVKGGPVHAKFRRMITVYVDITAPLYWWKEFDTYKVGTVANSCSTMHKIHSEPITAEDFSWDREEDCLEYYVDEYGTYVDIDDLVVFACEELRKKYIETGDKKYWRHLIQLLPSSYNQKRTVMLNYEVLANMYQWRKNHKLDEWRSFCEWIETLPYSEIITEQREPEHNPLAHPETYVADAIDMIGDMTEAQRVEVMKYLKVKTPEECPYWDYKEHKSLGTCNGCETENQGVIINGDRYCNIVSPTKEEE